MYILTDKAYVQGSTNGSNVQGSTNGTIGNTIGTNGNANVAIGSPNGTIDKLIVLLVSQWYNW